MAGPLWPRGGERLARLQQSAAALVPGGESAQGHTGRPGRALARKRAWPPSPRSALRMDSTSTSGAALATESFRRGLVRHPGRSLAADRGARRHRPRADACWISARRRAARPWRWRRGRPVDSVVACDVRPRRVRLLRQTLARLPGAGGCRAGGHRAATSRSPPTPSTYVLVDAPCSGLGTLRRDPDIRWTAHRLPTSSASPRPSSRCCSGRRGSSPPGARSSTPPVRASPRKTTRSWRNFSATRPASSRTTRTGPLPRGRARSVLRRRARLRRV